MLVIGPRYVLPGVLAKSVCLAPPRDVRDGWCITGECVLMTVRAAMAWVEPDRVLVVLFAKLRVEVTVAVDVVVLDAFSMGRPMLWTVVYTVIVSSWRAGEVLLAA